jgi:hypothetical protein
MEIPIPSKEPWSVRACPERHRRKLIKLGRLIGVVGNFLWFVAGLFAIVFGPVKFAMMEPDAPFSRPIIWLGRAVGPTAFCIIYFSVMVAVAFVLMWGMKIHAYSRSQRGS